jgi:hypothetical protein
LMTRIVFGDNIFEAPHVQFSPATCYVQVSSSARYCRT